MASLRRKTFEKFETLGYLKTKNVNLNLRHSFFLIAVAIFLQDLERSEVCISKQVGDARVGR